MGLTAVPEAKPLPVLRLFIAGDTPGARRAQATRLQIIEVLRGRVDIEVVDVLMQPNEAERFGILATPTLSDDSVQPPRRLIGDISNVAQVLEFFGYRKEGSTS